MGKSGIIKVKSKRSEFDYIRFVSLISDLSQGRTKLGPLTSKRRTDMKKPLAVLLLILGGAVTVTLADIITAFGFFMLVMLIPSGIWLVYTILAMFLFYASYPLMYIRENIKTKYNINAVVFVVCFCAPSLIASGAAYFFAPDIIGDMGFISGEGVLAFWFVSTAVFSFWTIVHTCIASYKTHIDKNA